jgi:hypothetical protein
VTAWRETQRQTASFAHAVIASPNASFATDSGSSVLASSGEPYSFCASPREVVARISNPAASGSSNSMLPEWLRASILASGTLPG